MRQKIIIGAVAAIAVFLVGFVPQYVRANRLDAELRQVQQSMSFAGLRDLAALAYVQASEKNYGLAAGSATRFFSQARELANQARDPNGRKALEGLQASRDKITAELAKGDAAAMGDLDQLFHQARRATGAQGQP